MFTTATPAHSPLSLLWYLPHYPALIAKKTPSIITTKHKTDVLTPIGFPCLQTSVDVYYIFHMSETLSVRLPKLDKQQLQEAANRAGESLAEFVRKAALKRAEGEATDAWETHFGAVDSNQITSPRNEDIRRIMGSK